MWEVRGGALATVHKTADAGKSTTAHAVASARMSAQSPQLRYFCRVDDERQAPETRQLFFIALLRLFGQAG